MTQLGMAVFGLVAIWLAMGRDERARRWAPVIGLAGQPFWAAFAWHSAAWGLGVLVLAYTAVYARGTWMQWRRTV